MTRLNRRVHVLLDDSRFDRLRERAAASGTSVGGLIRAAIDRELERDDRSEAVAALEAFLAAPPVHVGTPEELKRDLRRWADEELD
ncbi:MAG: ribbon-helix-helix protein, CopG family [Solirubrobacterales bacterium]|nr:ribbon-helix-helix protein, CopG family [Solirubrobacterales bacterium]